MKAHVEKNEIERTDDGMAILELLDLIVDNPLDEERLQSRMGLRIFQDLFSEMKKSEMSESEHENEKSNRAVYKLQG